MKQIVCVVPVQKGSAPTDDIIYFVDGLKLPMAMFDDTSKAQEIATKMVSSLMGLDGFVMPLMVLENFPSNNHYYEMEVRQMKEEGKRIEIKLTDALAMAKSGTLRDIKANMAIRLFAERRGLS